MAVVGSFMRRLGSTIRDIGRSKGLGGWYSPRMAAAERAILERVPMVDLLVEVRDARIPLASAFEPVRHLFHYDKHVIVLNKVDLADSSLTEEQHICLALNSHNHNSIKQLLNVVKKKVKDLKVGKINDTATILLVGIPNVGKSAIANSLHLLGRIDALEKGKLKHATVSPVPGETTDIRGYKIASHPNIYVFDTPGVLPAEIADEESGSKLALTGAINDSLIGEYNLAQLLLAVLSSSNVYKCWEKFSTDDHMPSNLRRRRQFSSDHTQDFIVWDVRQTLLKIISSFQLHSEKEEEMERLIECEFNALCEAFRISILSEDRYDVVASKLLNLYRTGRLGRYTLDPIPGNFCVS
ncbi:hypothetical protein HPP92_001581 [Vanilla planifolia]|uniref:G domain-containing protein n=1 Tax=Vanilla planifolia TaxID=51239 RepID=A0A835RYA5_VANPL|nr:hypothetical protein HPP92_001581 [Vanilla planifolia]